MVWEDKPINKDLSRPVAGYKDPKTGKTWFTDPGWSDNPGKESWQIDLGKYSAAVSALVNQQFVKANTVKQAMQWAIDNYAEKILLSAGRLSKTWGKKIIDNSALLGKLNEVNRTIGEFQEMFPDFKMPKINTVCGGRKLRTGRAAQVEAIGPGAPGRRPDPSGYRTPGGIHYVPGNRKQLSRGHQSGLWKPSLSSMADPIASLSSTQVSTTNAVQNASIGKSMTAACIAVWLAQPNGQERGSLRSQNLSLLVSNSFFDKRYSSIKRQGLLPHVSKPI